MPIDIVAAGTEFILTHIGEDGSQTNLPLSDADVLSLARSAESFRDHILAKHTPKGGGLLPSVNLLVSRIGLNHTILQGDLVISLFQANGREHRFSVPRDVAETMPEAISKYLAAMGRQDGQLKN